MTMRSVGTLSRSHGQRPLSITVIGLYMLFGAAVMPINIFTHAPAFLMSMEFRGGRAIVFFLVIGTLDAVIGVGLLNLAPWSRVLAIYFFLFRIANTSFTFLVPESRAQFEQGVAAMQAALGPQAARRSPTWFGPAFELSLMAVIVCLLITHKKVFPAPHAGATLAR